MVKRERKEVDPVIRPQKKLNSIGPECIKLFDSVEGC